MQPYDPNSYVDAVGEVILKYAEASHCFQREGREPKYPARTASC